MSEVVTIQDEQSGASASIAVHFGFNCFDFTVSLDGKTIPVIDAPADFAEGDYTPTSYGIPLLFPFPNRIRQGKMTWEGVDYSLPTNGALGNAIHGFCLDRPWRVVDQGTDFVEGEFQLSKDAADLVQYWPADFIIRVRYQVTGTKLRSVITVRNPDRCSLPWGFGTHAYFRLPLSPVNNASTSDASKCLVHVAASEEWALKDLIPTGDKHPIPESIDMRAGREFGSLQVDNVLSGLPEDDDTLNYEVIDNQAGLKMVQSCPREMFPVVVVYKPPQRDAICMEPYTCITDAINLQPQGVDAGWLSIPPNEDVSTWIDISLEKI